MSSTEVMLYARKSSIPRFRGGSFELRTIHEDERVSPSELDRLKSVAARLELTTRRASVVEWRAALDKPPFLRSGARPAGDAGLARCLQACEKTREEREADLQRSIDWIKYELAAMKSQDHALAMQLMRLRGEIQHLRLQHSISEHKDLIEDAAYSVEEELEQKASLCDNPLIGVILPGLAGPLKDIGVTRMNLNARRFSLR